MPLPASDQLSLVSEVRAFLGLDSLPPHRLATPQVDPVRFQSLDRLIVPRKWLPTVRKCKAIQSTGFPSDHFLLLLEVKVRLGARRQRQLRPPPLEYNANIVNNSTSLLSKRLTWKIPRLHRLHRHHHQTPWKFIRMDRAPGADARVQRRLVGDSYLFLI